MLQQELTSYYHNLDLANDINYQRIHSHILHDLDVFGHNNPAADAVTTKSRLHTSIAEHFEPVIFLNSPFFYEMGIKDAGSWGVSSRPASYLREKQREKVLLNEDIKQAYSDFAFLNAQIGQNHSTHFGLYRMPSLGGFDIDHNSIGYSMLFDIGISGLLQKIQTQYASFTKDSSEYAFCKACEESCQALIKIAHKFSDAAKKMLAQCQTETQNKYMHMIAESALHIPENPPRTFYEGLAMIWFLREVIGSLESVGISVLGQLDVLLYKLYEKDLQENRITEEEARELIRLWLMPTDIKFRSIENKWPETSTCITLGGCDRYGNMIYNEITRFFIEEHCKMHLVAPKLNLRYSSKSPDDYLQLISEKILDGNNVFALSCDDIVIPSLQKCGFLLEDARRYVNGGCQETMVEGVDIPPEPIYMNYCRHFWICL